MGAWDFLLAVGLFSLGMLSLLGGCATYERDRGCLFISFVPWRVLRFALLPPLAAARPPVDLVR